MKSNFLKLSTILLFFALVSAGCLEDEEIEYSEPVKGYIVGSFIGVKTNAETGESLGIITERGYCILLEGNEDVDNQSKMDFYTFNLPQDLFDFSNEILSSTYNSYTCGPVFFPDSLIHKYLMSFQYKIKSEEEKVRFGFDGPCFSFLQLFPWDTHNEVSLNNTSIIIQQ